MTESPFYQKSLWREQLAVGLTDRGIDRLEEQLDIAMPWYFNEHEWVVGYRILRTADDAATFLRVVRMEGSPGVEFELLTSDPQEDLTLWQSLRQHLRAILVDLFVETGQRPGLPELDAALQNQPLVTLSQMIAAGMHFGHRRTRWNPKMGRYIAGQRNGLDIIDLRQSLERIDLAYNFLKGTVAAGGNVLFVGSKPHAKGLIQQNATRVDMPYVSSRWLGGMLTNFNTIATRIDRLDQLDQWAELGWPSSVTKKERVLLERSRAKLTRSIGGIRHMRGLPDALWVIDTPREHLAVSEARKLGIPVVAIADTNSDPDEIDFLIPGNDDAVRTTSLMTRVMADAVAEGLMARGEEATTTSVSGVSTPAEDSAARDRMPPEPDVSTDDRIAEVRTRPPLATRKASQTVSGPPPTEPIEPAWMADERRVGAARAAGDTAALAEALDYLGANLWRSNEIDRARSALDEAIELYRQLTQDTDEANFGPRLDRAIHLRDSFRERLE